VTPDLEDRLSHGRDDAPRHLIFIHLVTRVNTGDDHIKLLEDPVGIIQRTILGNVRLSTFQDLDLCLFLHSIDFFPLTL